jgi:phosphoesterase RecJ-like protein
MMKNLDSVLEGKNTIGIAGHVRPDGDCVGSSLAVYNYIKDHYPNADVRVYLEPMPSIFHFLSGVDQIRHQCTDEMIFDLFIAVDCADDTRLGDAAKYFDGARHTVCIDHHVSNRAFAEENYIFPDASSTCELVFELMDEKRITKEIAECLYTGIVHDTGVFQYSCTSSKTMNIAGVLMDKGIDYNQIIDETFHAKTYNQNRMMGRALLDSKLYMDGRVILSAVTKKTMDEYEVLPKHMEGIVSQLRVTTGVEVAVLLYENEDHTYKVSFRVNGDFDAAALAMTFGGGGHVKAAGCTLGPCLEENIDSILTEIKKRL